MLIALPFEDFIYIATNIFIILNYDHAGFTCGFIRVAGARFTVFEQRYRSVAVGKHAK